MSTLSRSTLSQIACALANAYEEARKQAAWWDERVEHPTLPEGAAVACAHYWHEEVKQRGAALQELAQLAPWIRLMHECKPLFEQEINHPTKQEST